MILSHKKRFIFIHVYKVAGTSIKSELSSYSESKKSQLSWSLRYRGLFSENKLLTNDYQPHTSANELKKQLPGYVFDKYFKFAFVRNPYSWQVSLYNYMLQHEDHKQHHIIKKIDSFEEYLDWRINYDLKYQKDFVTDNKNRLLVDKVGKLENLHQDFRDILNKLSIPYSPMKHLNRSTSNSHLSYYNEKSLELVYQAFKPDFDLFGYKKLTSIIPEDAK